MLNLAVCDDNTLFLEEMKGILEKDERVENVTLYENPEQFLEVITKNQKDFDAVFMDIEFEIEGDGICCAKQIFRKAPRIQIVYVTGYQDKYAQHIFLTEANLTGYLKKPLDKKILGHYLDKILEKKEPKGVFHFSIKGKDHFLAADSIFYLESSNHKVFIHTSDNVYTIYEKLSNLKQQLPFSFIQCHKSFLINMNQITHIEGNEVHFPDSQPVPVSKMYQEEVRNSFFSYIGSKV